MINNIFVLNSTGDVLIEKHFVGQTKRHVCDRFWEEVQKHSEQTSVPPIIVTPNYYLLHVRRNGMFFLTASNQEDPPLLILELLHRAVDVLLYYFRDADNSSISLRGKGRLTDQTVRENFSLVYHLLDEMVDGGFPSTTDFNQLVELIAPSGLADISKKMFVSNYSKFKSTLPASVTSKTPWRRTNVKYVSNEIKLDIVERVDAIFGANDRLVSSEINGIVECNAKLSGQPELELTFTNSHMLNNNVKLHRCVLIKRFTQENKVIFVPPDGKFSLMEFSLPNNTNLPLHVRPVLNLTGPTGRVTVTLSQRGKNVKSMENVVITIPFPKETSSFSLSANCGKVIPDEITKVVTWTLSKYPRDKNPMLEGTVSLPKDYKNESHPSVKADFHIKQYSVSGLKVDTLAVHKVNYKPFKGVRSNTRAGSYRIRT